MTGAAIISALILGMGGSLHCLGMCGPLVMAMPFHILEKRKRIPAVIWYNVGRIGAYGMLGILVFAFGESMDWLGISQYLSVALGVLILLNLALPVLSKKTRIPFFQGFRKWQARAMQWLMKKRNVSWLGFTGFLNGLLPCGLVYIALAASLATASVLPSYYFMLFFGMGTFPAMAVIAVLGQKISLGTRLKLRKVTPALSLVVAVLLVIRGLNIGIPYLSPELKEHQHKTEMNCCKAH